jgi:hypothetical protein
MFCLGSDHSAASRKPQLLARRWEHEGGTMPSAKKGSKKKKKKSKKPKLAPDALYEEWFVSRAGGG